MRTDELEFPLPEELIALHPPSERAASRLLAASCRSGALRHLRFADLAEVLRPGDLLVRNDTLVVPARIVAHKETGGAVEGLWLETAADGRALLMLSGSRLREGSVLVPDGTDLRLELAEKAAPGRWWLRELSGRGWAHVLERAGRTPLPPYIRSRRVEAGEPETDAEDRARYQSLWARRPGAVAAPTASLHFDARLERALADAGVESAWLTLHVGPGTFQPVAAERLEDHAMHAERFVVPAATLEALQRAHRQAARVVALGTTVCRVLEHLGRHGWAPGEDRRPEDLSGATELFITPGFRFRWTGALVTNFHTPRSTLLALVAAFAQHAGARDGLRQVKEVYAEAVARRYRFYSYGDATFWEP